jgi:hypothetical protein
LYQVKTQIHHWEFFFVSPHVLCVPNKDQLATTRFIGKDGQNSLGPREMVEWVISTYHYSTKPCWANRLGNLYPDLNPCVLGCWKENTFPLWFFNATRKKKSSETWLELMRIRPSGRRSRNLMSIEEGAYEKTCVTRRSLRSLWGCKVNLYHVFFKCTRAVYFWGAVREATRLKLPLLHPASWERDLTGEHCTTEEAASFICGAWSLFLDNRYSIRPLRQ